MSSSLDCEAVEHFKEYLRIRSVQPDVDYSECVEFVKRRASELGLEVSVVEVGPRKPVVVVHWIGREPKLASVLLSSHMDVVPVYPAQWTHPPFDAKEDAEGNIYARGAQDMKSVAIQYLEAVCRLIIQGYQPKRTVHICFTPDEEIGSLGMKAFVDTQAFKDLNVGCELDEGVPSPTETYDLFYGERTAYRYKITCLGTPGHGSLLHDNTAGEKLNYVINKFMEKRLQEKKKLIENSKLIVGDVTTINLTVIEGGVQSNVVPPELSVQFDCRLSLDEDHEEFEQWVDNVCKNAGEGVTAILPDKKKRIEPTNLDTNNPWWVAMKGVFSEMELKVKTGIFPAATDARYMRALGIPAFGFSALNNTPIKLHDHDEFLNVSVFLRGIEIYTKLIPALSNV